MRICFVGSANSAHIVKWCTWFASRGHEIHVISFLDGMIPHTQVHTIDLGVDANGSDLGKLKYLTSAKRIKKLIGEIKPDIVNVHYASSYGLAVALSGVKDYILSVWGSDIYDFPQKGLFHRAALKYSLNKAPYLFSTSMAMAKEAGRYTKKRFEITPFGVDMDLFNPNKRINNPDKKMFIVGTVKKLSDKYGIKSILEAVAEIKHNSNIPIELRIAGKGPQEEEYHRLAKKLEIDDITKWLGFISQEEAAYEWANMDIGIIPSEPSESFGVAAVEAQACGTPLIVSNVGGLLETTIPQVTSLVVPCRDEKAIADSVIELFNNPGMRKMMGTEGRKNALEKYRIDQCFEKIESFYMGLLK